MHMSVKFRLAAVLTLTASMSTLAATPALFGGCDSNGECSTIFNRSLPDVKTLCGERVTFIAWRKDSGSILLQCVGSATDGEQDVSYMVNGGNVVGLNSGRYIKINFLQSNPTASIPDKFGEMPVCAPANLEKLHKSTFVLLYKRPDDARDSYCYDITYLTSSVGGVRLDTNTGTVSTTDRTYFSGHIPDQTRQHVKKLIQMFQTWRYEQPE